MTVVVLLVSCASDGGPPARPPSAADYAGLAKHVLDNTPEHTHFVTGTRFSWCLFISPTNDPLPPLTAEVVARLRKKYTVYLAEEEIPSERKMYRGGQLAGFQGGFMFRIEVEPLGPARVRIHYYDWEGMLAASGRNVTYEWTGRAWQVVDKGNMWIS